MPVYSLSILVFTIGLVMFYIAANPKNVEVGKVMFTVGLLAFLLQSGSLMVGLFGRG